jgi:prepilin-type N-terminal cleavage/methylation domain-containing protein
MNLKGLTSNKGLTIIELIISIAVLGIILISAYSFLFFSNRTFSKGVTQRNVQSNIRIATDYITSQIRYATAVKILDSIDNVKILDPLNNINAYENYIFYDSGKIVRLSRYNSNSFYVGVGGGIEFSSMANEKILKFIIRAVDGKQSYAIQSEVRPLNLEIEGNNINPDIGPVIFYRTVHDYLAREALPEATLGDPTDSQIVNIHFNKRIERFEIKNDNTSSPLASIGITGPNNLEIRIDAPGASVGRSIVFVVELDDFGLYEYTLLYTTKWNIE